MNGTVNRVLFGMLVAVIVRGAAAVRGEDLPAVDYPVVIDLNYPDTAAAGEVWTPMQGSPPARPFRAGRVPALRLGCPFAGTDMERASWDGAVRLDLRLARGIRFMFRCADAAPVARFSLYFRSGPGWYSSSFSPRADGKWETIEILKANTSIEDTPNGWGQVEAIRISAWRGGRENTAFDVAAFGLLPADAGLAVVRGVSAAARIGKNEAKGIARYAENVVDHLGRAGIYPPVVDDVELTDDLLRGLKVVILPYSPTMSDKLVSRLSEFVRSGGRVIGFYSVRPLLLKALGMTPGQYVTGRDVPGGFGRIRFRSGALAGAPVNVAQGSWAITVVKPIPGKSRVLADWVNSEGADTHLPAVVGSDRGMWMTHVYLAQDPVNGPRMLLAMVGRYLPEVWERAAKAAVADIGRFRPYSGYAAAVVDLRRNRDADVSRRLQSAEQLAAAARRQLAVRRFVNAIDVAGQARQALQEAFFLAQKSLPGEFRGAWCHRAYGISGWSWDRTVQRFAASGFTAIFPNMLWGGAAYYPSKVLPVAPLVKEQGDQLAACLKACRKYGVQLHVWKVNFNLGRSVDPAFTARLKREGRLQEDAQGRRTPWLCPSHPLNRKLEIDSMVEVAKNYPVDGIHFDYIRYPGNRTCYCDGCRKRFEQFAGAPVTDWPGQVLKDGPLRRKWLAFRRSNITAVVKGVHDAAKKVRPDIKISAAVFRNWPTDRDTIGQDWVEWCRKGYLDFVCPMDYIPDDRAFERTVIRQLGWVRPTGVPLYPGIGLSTARFGATGLISQILITRRQRTGGFLVFEYNKTEATSIFPALGRGLTRSR
ncbi:MAG: family 10 glycosylhydrolase [Kiritimatiellaeota bacterium]|nr:family 10 glycosylhydrolase [Kiritimatiellota bacterium]